MALNELHELDPIRGLPEHLPEGEEILWQGGPDFWSLCRRAFHIALVFAYFMVLFAWQVAVEPAGSTAALAGAVVPLVLCCAASSLLMLIAYLITQTTTYTITNRRIVMQFGIALPVNLNLPFGQIAGAGHKQYKDGTGDMPLELIGENRAAYALLWPHARPWHVRQPQPMFRSVPDSAAAAAVLASALRQYQLNEPAGTDGRSDGRETPQGNADAISSVAASG